MALILITGTPRSGSGIIAGALRCCGMELGKCNNMRENHNLSKLMTELPNDYHTTVGRMRKYIHKHNITLFKHHDICKYPTLPTDLDPDAKVLIVLRDKLEVINSCVQTYHNNDVMYWSQVYDKYMEWCAGLRSTVINCYTVYPGDYLHNGLDNFKDLTTWLQIDTNGQALNYLQSKLNIR